MQYFPAGDGTIAQAHTPAHAVVVRMADLVADGHASAALFIGEKLMKRHRGGLIGSEPFWFWLGRAAEDLELPKAVTYMGYADQLRDHRLSAAEKTLVN